METPIKRLYRSKTDRKLGGVCGGLAEYFGVDPIFFRLGFILFSLAYFTGAVVYLLMWWLVPEKPFAS